MPDFEALVRHQQTSRRPAVERLKVLEKPQISSESPTNGGRNLSTLFFGFVGGLFGAIIGTGLIFYLSSQDLIDFNILF